MVCEISVEEKYDTGVFIVGQRADGYRSMCGAALWPSEGAGRSFFLEKVAFEEGNETFGTFFDG